MIESLCLYLHCLSAALLCYTGFQNHSLIRSTSCSCSTCRFGLGFQLQNLQDFIKISRALIKDIFLRVLEVAAKEGTRTCGLVELHDIVTTMLACAHAEDSIQKYEENAYLAVVICCDANVFHNASGTRCDVFLDVCMIGGHTVMVVRGPHGGFLMSGLIWPIC